MDVCIKGLFSEHYVILYKFTMLECYSSFKCTADKIWLAQFCLLFHNSDKYIRNCCRDEYCVSLKWVKFNRAS